MYNFKLANKDSQYIIEEHFKDKHKFPVYSAKGFLIGYITKENNHCEEKEDLIENYLYEDNSFEDMNTRLSSLC